MTQKVIARTPNSISSDVYEFELFNIPLGKINVKKIYIGSKG